MAPRTVWHFAYGSNMNRTQMRSRVGNVLEEHNAHLPNYELRFNKKVRGGDRRRQYTTRSRKNRATAFI